MFKATELSIIVIFLAVTVCHSGKYSVHIIEEVQVIKKMLIAKHDPKLAIVCYLVTYLYCTKEFDINLK